MDEFPTLKTKRLVLREFHLSDVSAVFDIFSQDAVARYTNHEIMQSSEEAEKLVGIRMMLFEKRRGVRWAVVLKGQEDRLIGSCGYFNLDTANRKAEIGYELHPDHWRKGIMTEALTAAIDFGYSDGFFFWLNRIEALTYPQNKASAGLLKKLKFQEEGIRREYGYWEDKYHDLQSFSLLRRDWIGETGS